jgi:hypothetical protein
VSRNDVRSITESGANAERYKMLTNQPTKVLSELYVAADEHDKGLLSALVNVEHIAMKGPVTSLRE